LNTKSTIFYKSGGGFGFHVSVDNILIFFVWLLKY
jgi:hypothetical protein